MPATTSKGKKAARRKAPSASRPRKIPPSRTDRQHASDRTEDQRTSFERDRDRVLYSSALRRLAGVTQVVHAAEGHIFHNRLTHTLKVAQVARRVAENILRYEPRDLIETVGGIDPDVVETAALVHDLGHPPFGHIAEEELDQQLIKQGVMDGYEGNAQSFRIITKVAIRNLSHRGLNLTRASMNAVIKYPWDRSPAGKKARKWNYYYSERDDFEFARALGPAGQAQSAEAAIMDWADDVAYSVHDVDDFYRAGLVPLDQLLLGMPERERFINAVYSRWEEEGQTSRLEVLDREAASDFFDNLRFWAEAEDLDISFTGTRVQRARLSFLSAFLIRRYVMGPEDGSDTKAVTLAEPLDQPSVRIEPRLRVEVDLLKALMQYYVFHNPGLVTQQYGQRRVIKELFEIYFKAVKPNSHNTSIIPYPFRDYLEEIEESNELERARLVADLIASMTEQQALLLHQRLTGITPGSVRDPIIR